eukprot:PITA_24239
MECDIHLCSKGFFIVKFASTEAKDTIISAGPWFWGTSGLSMTPWFPDFDPNKMTVSRMPVWVRLYNLPLHFWSERFLEGIGNSIGKYIKTDLERIEERIYTFAHICVEVDLSKGLPKRHLQSTCPEVKKANSKKKQKGKQRKGWQFPPLDLEDDESEAEEEVTPTENTEPTQGEETQKENISANKVSQLHSNQAEKTSEDLSMGGIKRHHPSDTSDSDKDTAPQKVETQLVLATIKPTQGEWCKAEKKKGRKT